MRVSTPPGVADGSLLDELASSLQNAEMVLIAEIFRAREGPPQPGEATAADLYRRATALGARGVPAHALEEITATLETRLLPGDVLVTLGAGDIGRIGHGFLGAVSRRSCGRMSRWRCTPGFSWAARRNTSPNRKTSTS